MSKGNRREAFYKELIINYLKQFDSASKDDIRKLLIDKLPDAMGEDQKENKIRNLLYPIQVKEILCRTSAEDFYFNLSFGRLRFIDILEERIGVHSMFAGSHLTENFSDFLRRFRAIAFHPVIDHFQNTAAVIADHQLVGKSQLFIGHCFHDLSGQILGRTIKKVVVKCVLTGIRQDFHEETALFLKEMKKLTDQLTEVGSSFMALGQLIHILSVYPMNKSEFILKMAIEGCSRYSNISDDVIDSNGINVFLFQLLLLSLFFSIYYIFFYI